mmetsp:Transcript_8282/g.17665  ORF Transcript_8282/g.17665 Transcript_8282/m.17665 type:complete len:200 (-) Transcript_8282:401-1000(-)
MAKFKKGNSNSRLNSLLRRLRPFSEFDDFEQDWNSSGDLPNKKPNTSKISTNMNSARSVTALLHGRNHRSGKCPEYNKTGSCVEMRTREKFPRSSIGVEGSLNGERNSNEQKQGTLVEMLVTISLTCQFLSFYSQIINLALNRQSRLKRCDITRVYSLGTLRSCQCLANGGSAIQIGNDLLQSRNFIADGSLTAPLESK